MVSRMVTPLVHERADRGPHLLAAARVEAGGRLVEEEQRGPLDHADREVEPALHPAGVGADPAVGGVDEVELVEELVGAASGGRAADSLRSRAIISRFSRPVSSVVDGGVLAGQADRPAGSSRACVGRSWPGDARPSPRRAGPASPGCAPAWSCRRRWARAARRRCPLRSARSRPSRTRVPPKDLREPGDFNCVRHTQTVYVVH